MNGTDTCVRQQQVQVEYSSCTRKLLEAPHAVLPLHAMAMHTAALLAPVLL
jgi:hypothetical protein